VKLIDVIEAKNEALRVRDIARILGVSAQQIYKMAARGQIPSFRVANAIRFDPTSIRDLAQGEISFSACRAHSENCEVRVSENGSACAGGLQGRIACPNKLQKVIRRS
jgi:excisionase family DNA binding protein